MEGLQRLNSSIRGTHTNRGELFFSVEMTKHKVAYFLKLLEDVANVLKTQTMIGVCKLQPGMETNAEHFYYDFKKCLDVYLKNHNQLSCGTC